jgi:uncharacterized protein (DUF2062 family)
MKGVGWLLAVIGLVVAVLGVVNHFAKLGLPVISTMAHGNIIAAVVGAVVFVIGAFLAMRGGGAAAA